MAYEKHPRVSTPRADRIVWRYMSFLKFVEMLETASLWFTRADQLDDPREGRFTDEEIKQLQTLPRDVAESHINMFERARTATFVSCWHESNFESMAMWDLYAKSPGSIAIKSTIGQLKKALSAVEQPIRIGRINYLDWTRSSWENNIFGMFVRKVQSYKHENEVRLFFWIEEAGWKAKISEMCPVDAPAPSLSGGVNLTAIADLIGTTLSENFTFPGSSESDLKKYSLRAVYSWMEQSELRQIPRRIPVAIDLGKLFDEVVIGPREHKSFLELVARVMKRIDIKKKVLPSRLTCRDFTFSH